ncbi:MAG TPA: MFS transporter [Stenomitos sp.]
MSPDPTEISERNFWLNVLDGAFFPAGYAFIGPATVLPLFVSSMTASKLTIGVASALIMVGLALPQLWSAWMTLRVRRFWRWFLVSNGLVRLTVLPLLLVPFLPMPYRLYAFLCGIFAFAAAWGIATPSWSDFVGRLVPADRRGSFFGLRGALQGPASMVATLGATALLGALPAPWSFGACFLAALGFMSLSYACMGFTRVRWQQEVVEPDRQAPFWGTLWAKLRAHPSFGRYALCRLVVACGTASTGFWVVGGQERFALSSSHANLLGLALLALPTLTGVWWGRLGDRRGPKAQLWAAIGIGAIANLLLAFSTQLWLYVTALVLVGLTTSLLVMADFAFLYDACPEERATYFGLFNVLLLPATLGVPIGAGLLADHWGLGAVFGASAAAWILGGIGLLLVWPQPRSLAATQVLT